MKAEELMIGDWVNIHGDNWRATLATLQLAWDKPGTIKPIPLTAEILEKNGFIRINADVTTYKLTKYLYWTPRGLEHELSEIPICLLNYVHELQHALKLCGIDKEIVV